MRLGNYEVEGEIGRGGVGAVYRGRAPDGREVAIKVLLRPEARNAAARFERERRLLASFREEDGFVPLLDAGDSPSGPYLVMPFVTGGTLRDRIRKRRLDGKATLALGRALARALGRAHERGIVHRDLKPENVLFSKDGRPLVADLGLAKHFTDAVPGASQSVSLSQTSELMGTPAYMPAEQLTSTKLVGPPSDVFALGAILYECLDGHPAFEGETFHEVCAKVALGDHVPISRKRPDAPPALASVIERALSVKPESRYPDANALLEALEAAERGRGSGGARLAVLSAVSLAVLLALGAGVAFLLASSSSVETPDAPPSKATTSAKPSPPAKPQARGWTGEALPEGLRRGASQPVCLWKLPAGSGDMELVYVPPGDFTMGSDDEETYPHEQPKHRHPMPHGYWIGRNDVTWGQYLGFCSSTRRAEPARPPYEWTEDHPVVNVTWDDARDYCKWAGLHIPTEVEWEKAARGDDGRKYPWGEEPPPREDGDPALALSVWQHHPVHGGRGAAPVGSCPRGASPYGALDMAGNVWQWCEDSFEEWVYERYAHGDISPPHGPVPGTRGGCFINWARFCRTANRGGQPNGASIYHGFRVVLRSEDRSPESKGTPRSGVAPGELPPNLRYDRNVTLPGNTGIPVYQWKLPGDAGEIELVRVPSGEFIMGPDQANTASEGKERHREPMPRGYWIGRNPTTFRQFRAFCTATSRPAPAAPSWGAQDDHPVVNVTWEDAKAFCEWAKLQLPTEAQWEKAARGTAGRTYPWGEAQPTEKLAVFASHPLYGQRSTAPVGSCPDGSSVYGAVDMAGNVYQWCDDWILYEQGDRSRPGSGGRVGKGGSWWADASFLRSASRVGANPNEFTGFRVVLWDP